MKKPLPTWFWRVLTGLIIGIICDYLVLLLIADKQGTYYAIAPIRYTSSLIWYPILGITSFGNVFPDISSEAFQNILGIVLGVVIIPVLFLFHPIFIATALYFGGKKQTGKVISKEIILVIVYIALFVLGMFNQP